MKIYKFVGSGVGVPGLPHKIKQSEGDRWITEFERALKTEKAKTKDDVGPFQAQQMPGAILKGALANGNYKPLSTTKEKGSSKEEKEN